MKRIVLFLTLSISSNTFAFPNDHGHNFPNSFRVTCKAWNDSVSRADFIWDNKSNNMIITGDSIRGDRGYLNIEKSYNIENSIKVATVFFEEQIYKHTPSINSPNTKDLHMTFRTKHNDMSAYHGKGWTNIRTFKFRIIEGKSGYSGYIVATDATDIEGVIEVSNYGVLSNCTFVDIYATP